MGKPYDKDFINQMDYTANKLCEEIQGCKMAYVQSDEISLLLTDFDKITTDAWFDGQIQKMVSVAASMATGYFNKHPHPYQGDKIGFFDARIFTIPDPVEVENYFIWRQKDAIRNSLSMHAQALYSHKELHGKSQKDMHDMIYGKGENWDKLPDGFKRGRTIRKVRLFDIENAGMTDDVIDMGTEWAIKTPDFLKEREELSDLIPKINWDLV